MSKMNIRNTELFHFLLKYAFRPLTLVAIFREQRRWRLVGRNESQVTITNRKTTLTLSTYYARAFFVELQVWKKHYLPRFDLSGKTILDVGAGNGETAYFYLSHRASKVICVESDAQAFALLQENAARNSWNVECMNRSFGPDVLNLDYDFAKFDCEGCEKQLLALEKIGFPCVIETHDNCAKEFVVRFGMTDVQRVLRGVDIVRNF